jgi:hypothetical protein
VKNKNKGIAALIIGALLLLAFRKKLKGSVSVDQNPTLIKSPDADFLVKMPDGVEFLASDGIKVMGKTNGIVYVDGWFSRQYPQFYIVRQFGSTAKYYVYAGSVTRL